MGPPQRVSKGIRMAKNSPARNAKTGRQKSFEQNLWDTADKLRGTVIPEAEQQVAEAV